jgi:Fe-S cluster biogenesis protein NfuA
MSHSQELRESVARIEGLVQTLESTADPASRAAAKELVECLMDLHGAAIQRILEIVSKTGDSGARIINSLATDELVSSLLVLYELHPDDFETRVRRGLDNVNRFVSSRGASLDVLAVTGGTVHVRIQTGGHSCGSTGREIESAVREALFETAPDATEVLIEGVDEQASAAGFVPLASLQPSNGFAAPPPVTGSR